MSKRLQKTVLMGIIGIAAMSAQTAKAGTNQISSTSSAASSSAASSSAAASTTSSTINSSSEESTENKESSSSEKNNNSSIVSDESAIKQNNQIGPGYYEATQNKKVAVQSRSLFSTTRSTQSFIDSIRTGAISGWTKYGVLPSVSGAQAILESGWGQSTLSTEANNLFGIKGSYNGQSVIMPTQEYINGQWITINAQFRKYPSWNESIEDHGNFLASNSRYDNLIGQTNYKTVTTLLQQDGYATAPTYADSLNRIIETYGLNVWDNEVLDVNVADLNEATVNANSLHVRGWHVATDAISRPNSFLFLLDTNSKKEVKRYKIQRKVRQDVNNAYPSVTNALNSGFDENLTLSPDMYGRSFVLMSRYSADINGNGSDTDYTFKQEVKIPDISAANLDGFNIANNKINITGWHATSLSRNAKSSYLILMDQATGQEYKRYQITRNARPDVQAAYPNILNADKSGFNASIPVTSEMEGKTFKVISRYAGQPDGQDRLSDTSFNQTINIPKKNNANKAHLDEGWIDGDMLRVRGWHAIDDISNKPYHTLIFMDAKTNTELHRTQVSNTQRTDVNNAYPNIANSLKSGFETNVNLTANMRGKQIYVLSRYSKDRSANSSYIDNRIGNLKVSTTNGNSDNMASLDQQNIIGTNLNLSGWHASNASRGKKYHFLILMDRNTNTEIKRVKVVNNERPDVQKAYPSLYNSLNSGFKTSIKVDKNLKGRYVYLLSRYTSDSAGNLDSIDYLFSTTVFVK